MSSVNNTNRATVKELLEYVIHVQQYSTG